MIALSVTDVARLTGGELCDASGSSAAAVVSSVTVDSRVVRPGSLFVALAGERTDGHEHAGAAVAAGAVAVLAARRVGVPAIVVDDVVRGLGRLARAVVDRLPDLTVIGLTGSSGKTSTKDLIAQVLEGSGETVAPQGSFNNEIGVPLTALSVAPTTRNLVIEMGARGPGHIAYLCGVTPPRIGLVLNIGSAHAGVFGGREATATAKRELVEALPTAASGGVAVLNADDPLVLAMAGSTVARVVLFGRAPEAAVRALDVSLDPAARPRFTLVTPEGSAEISLTLHGEHHVANALAAAAVGRERGLDVATVAAALSRAGTRSPWRMQVAHRDDGLTVVNDTYNANPESVRAALAALVAIGGGSRVTWAVLGEMLELGATSAHEHAALGREAARLHVSRLVAVGEGARPILSGWTGQPQGAAYVADAASATALLREQVRPGDVVLVKASRGIGLERVADSLGADSLGADSLTQPTSSSPGEVPA